MPRFQLHKASYEGHDFEETRCIDTLDGLLALLKEFGHDIIVSTPIIGTTDYDYSVTIYDDYVE